MAKTAAIKMQTPGSGSQPVLRLDGSSNVEGYFAFAEASADGELSPPGPTAVT
jgi:hypothetical protein